MARNRTKCESFSSSGVSRPSPCSATARSAVRAVARESAGRITSSGAGRSGRMLVASVPALALAIAATPLVPAAPGRPASDAWKALSGTAAGSSNSRISSSKIAPTRLTTSPVSACARALISSASASVQSAGLSAQT